ncbi:MAG: hypothetical protein IPM13_11710 [Phycisphaerales bacterium]|nr:hypothetical protein [Phycisphaerales bacterium]
MQPIKIEPRTMRRPLTALAACVVTLLATGCERAPTAGAAATPEAAAVAQVAADATQLPDAKQASESPHKFVAYYFHRTLRCATCLSIEKQSREAIEQGYAGELSAGTLEWHAVNIDESEDEHFEKDFNLETQSLVLVERAGEKVARWRLLPKVWELEDDPHAFNEYVTREVARFIGGE